MSMFGLREQEGDPLDGDLPDHLRATFTGYWLELIARTKMPAARKSVAVMLATFANSDGSEVRPALEKVADMAGLHESNARNHVKALMALGLLAVKREGGGRGNPTVYRLTRPADITVLPLWLDPYMDRVPDGAGFSPLSVQTVAPALGNTDSSNDYSPAPALGNRPVDSPETVAHALGNQPVDNSVINEKGSDSEAKPPRFMAEKVALALPDLTKTRPRDQLWLRQVGTSLDAKIADERKAIKDLVADPGSDTWVPEASPPAPPAPQIVTAAAVLQPDDSALRRAIEFLEHLPDAGELYRAAAAATYRRRGQRNPTDAEITVMAASLAAIAYTETRPA